MRKPSKPAPDFRVKPGGPIDYDALHAAVAKRYPKVLARLAE